MHMDRERESYVQLLEFTPRLRRRVQDTIDELIDLLDAIDAAGDEIEDDDPPLGNLAALLDEAEAQPVQPMDRSFCAREAGR